MEKEMLSMLLTAQVLTLANQLKAEKAAKGVWTSSDMVYDAVALIKAKQAEVLAQLR